MTANPMGALRPAHGYLPAFPRVPTAARQPQHGVLGGEA
jgi:hypothetical protein